MKRKSSIKHLKSNTHNSRKKPHTKLEKQYNYIKSRNVNISKRAFTTYYNNLRKAKRKLSRDKGIMATKLYSLNSVSRITSKSELTRINKRLKEILSRGYKKTHNEEVRAKINTNLDYIYGEQSAQVKAWFNNLTDTQFIEFMESNPDIEQLQYLYEEEAKRFIDLLGLEINKIKGRFEYKEISLKIKKSHKRRKKDKKQ